MERSPGLPLYPVFNLAGKQLSLQNLNQLDVDE